MPRATPFLLLGTVLGLGCGSILGLDDFVDAGATTTASTSTTSTTSSTSSGTGGAGSGGDATTTSSASTAGGGGVADPCGNGQLDEGETCDGDCPTECIDGDLCTSEALDGSADTCDANCPHAAIVTCKSDDGCCPTGCFHGNDNDCDPRVIVVAWDGQLAAVRNALDGTGLFGEVAMFNAQMATPTLADLTPYDAALVYANVPFVDPVLLGDVLADYYDASGRVVVANGANCTDQYRIRGRFEADGFHVLEEGGVNPNPDTLGEVLEPLSPLLAGVDALEPLVHCAGAPTAGSTAVATYTATGAPVAVRGKVKGKNRVDVNVFPGAEYSEAGMVQLMANALLYPSAQ